MMKRCRKLLLTIALGVSICNLCAFAQLLKNGQADVSRWSKQFGPIADGTIGKIVSDRAYNVYLVGNAKSRLFKGGSAKGGIFIAKYSDDGHILWSKMLGSGHYDDLASAAPDNKGNLYIVGSTQGNLFSKKKGIRDAYVAKLAADGHVVWAKQFGSSQDNAATGVALEKNGGVCITGFTSGKLFSGNAGGSDFFVAKYRENGKLVFGKQIGGKHTTNAYAIAMDKNDDIYVTGETQGFGDIAQGSLRAYVAKIGNNGNLKWVAPIDVPSQSLGQAITVDRTGDIIVCGIMKFGLTLGHEKGFLAKLDRSGSKLWARNWTTTGEDNIADIAIDDNNNIYAVGGTTGNLFSKNRGGGDAVIAQYSSSGRLLKSSQFGTHANEGIQTVFVNGKDDLYIAGITDGSLLKKNSGERDIFVVKTTTHTSLPSTDR